MKRKLSSALFYLIFIFSLLLLFSYIWLVNNFGLVTLDSLIFHMFNPLKGTATNMILSYVNDPLLKTTLIVIVVAIIFAFPYKVFLSIRFFNLKKNNINIFGIIKKHRLILSIIFLSIVVIYILFDFRIIEYIKNLNTESLFIEEHYVEPENANITFTEQRNLIHIIVESFEQTFAPKEYGGAYEENLIPYLTKYASKEVSFTNALGGGFYNSRATNWTIAGLFAQTAGIGFFVPVSGNDYGQYKRFLPGAYSLGEILKKEGYNQVFLLGSESEFAGKNDYFEQHGNYVIKDYNYAKKNNWIPEDYYVWWGYEDSKLYEFTKNELLELASQKEPFNLTMLTTNTHHIGGYLESDCETKFNEQFKNVVACTDKQLYELIEWIKSQDFYKNTTIVITGDHLSMDPTFFDNLGDYERTNFNLFINSNKTPIDEKNRVFNTLDIYPTLVSSLGGNIEGDRLGLGTDLFSSTKTLYEEYGITYVENELAKNSSYFRNHIIYGR